MISALVHLGGAAIGWFAAGLFTSAVRALARRARRKRLLAYRQWRGRGGDPGHRLVGSRLPGHLANLTPAVLERLYADPSSPEGRAQRTHAWVAPIICQGCGNAMGRVQPGGEWDRPYCTDRCPPVFECAMVDGLLPPGKVCTCPRCRPFEERTAPGRDRPPPTRIPSAGGKRSM